jgi:hypothetical protein
MYECETTGCPEYVSHPGQFCLACTQRNEAEDEMEEEWDEIEGYL